MRIEIAALVLLVAFETTAPGAVAAEPRAGAGPSVALLPLVGSGLGADELARTERTIRREVNARFGKRSMKEQLVRARLDEGSAAGLRCDRAQVACLVQLGIVCQADAVLVASIAPGGAEGAGVESTIMSVRLVDVVEGQQVAFASVVVASSPLPEEVSSLLASLDQPQARALGIDVKGPAGAAVVVDGTAAGALPLVSPLPVAAGKHEVRVDTQPQPYVENVDVRPGELVVVTAPMPPPVEAMPQPVQPVASAPAATPVVEEPAGFPLVPTLAGAGTIALGTVALAIGVAPLIGYNGHATRLEEIDAEIGDDPAAVAERAAEVKGERDALEADDAAWNSYGTILAFSGGALVVIGAGVVVGALLFVE